MKYHGNTNITNDPIPTNYEEDIKNHTFQYDMLIFRPRFAIGNGKQLQPSFRLFHFIKVKKVVEGHLVWFTIGNLNDDYRNSNATNFKRS